MAEDIINPSPEPAAPAEIPLEQVVDAVFGKDSPAEAPAGAGAPVSPPPAGTPAADPAKDRVSAKIAAGLRAEKRAAEARRERAELETAKQRQAAEMEQLKAQIAEQVKTAEAFKAAKLSPSKALELLGTDGKTFLEGLVKENDPANVAARAVEGTNTEMEKLRAELKALTDAAKARDEAEKQRAHAEKYNAATQQFLEKVDAAPDKYPHLIAEYTAPELAAAARAAAAQHSKPYFDKYGEYPSDEMIAEYLEDQARARVEALAERRARVGQKAPPPSKGISSGDERAAQPDRGPSPRTLSSRQTSQRGSSPRPWSQEAADEESLRILSGAIK